jgi:hypothetical protein
MDDLTLAHQTPCTSQMVKKTSRAQAAFDTKMAASAQNLGFGLASA